MPWRNNENPIAVDLDAEKQQVPPRVGKLPRESLEGNTTMGEFRVLLPRTFTEISLNGGVLRGNVEGPELGLE